MPMYEVEHICPLTQKQKDDLADAITDVHSDKFTTPRLFVNVKITDVSKQDYYVGGKSRLTNRITAHVRTSDSRSKRQFDDLCTDLHILWSTIVHPGQPQGPAAKDQELRAVFIFGDIVAAWEAGFAIPAAGEDVQWARDHMQNFERLAREGDEDFVDLVADLKGRPEFQ